MALNSAISAYLARLKDMFATFGDKVWILGVSGGVDSAVCLAILVHLFPRERIRPFYITFTNDDGDQQALIDLLEARYKITIPRINMHHSLAALEADLSENLPQYTNNWLPKLRSLFLYDRALRDEGIVLSCLNYAEYYLGYFTKFGDGQGDFFPLSGLLKSQIYKLAHALGVPTAIIQAPPSPGFEGVTDAGELGFDYPTFERFLAHAEIDPEVAQKIAA